MIKRGGIYKALDKATFWLVLLLFPGLYVFGDLYVYGFAFLVFCNSFFGRMVWAEENGVSPSAAFSELFKRKNPCLSTSKRERFCLNVCHSALAVSIGLLLVVLLSDTEVIRPYAKAMVYTAVVLGVSSVLAQSKLEAHRQGVPLFKYLFDPNGPSRKLP